MLRTALLICLATTVAPAAHAQGAGTLGDVLVRGSAIRVWSAKQQVVGREGWIESAQGDSLRVRVTDAYGQATSEIIGVAKLDVDSVDVQRQGDWWRASFSDPVLRRVGELSAVDIAFAGIAPKTSMRLWSHLDSLAKLGVTFEGVRRDSVVVTTYDAGGSPHRRAFSVYRLDRVQVPGAGIPTGQGAHAGGMIGFLGGVAYALGSSDCTSSGGCGGGIPSQALPYGFVGGIAGALVGAAVAEMTHGTWRNVQLP